MKKDKLLSMIASKLKKHGAKKISIFGSYARNEEKEQSDVDVLVSFKTKKSLLELVRIERELSESVNKKIDLLTENSISPLIFKKIKKDLVAVY